MKDNLWKRRAMVYWDTLSAGGDAAAQQCGWLKGKFGLSWQIVPSIMGSLMSGPNAGRVIQAMMPMKKLDIATLKSASEGA